MSCDNKQPCSCTSKCVRHGKCCDCVAYHKSVGSLPVCLRDLKKESKKR
jgi:hypothetical protein